MIGGVVLEKTHYINVENGRFGTSGLVRTSPADLAELFTRLSADPHRMRPVVHFHGGLVGEKAGFAIAERLFPTYRNAGGYPIFYVWESGWNEVLFRNLKSIFGEAIFKRLLTNVLKMAVGKVEQELGLRGQELETPTEFALWDEIGDPQDGEPYAALEPGRLGEDEQLLTVEEQQLRRSLEQDPVFQQEAQSIAAGVRNEGEIEEDRERTRGLTVKASTATLMDETVIREMKVEAPSPGERGGWLSLRLIKGAISALGEVIRRYSGGRDHGVYPTVIEELLREFYLANAGQALWSQMKQDTEDAFGGDPTKHPGTAFVDGLAALVQETGVQPRPVLIGHSTGAVYICNFLRHADRVLPPEVRFDVVFLAGACRFNLLANVLARHGDRVADFRCFGLSDGFERGDKLVPVLYPRSLLYFVSGVVEDEADAPIVGMQRFFDGQRYPASAFRDVETVRQRLAGGERPLWAAVDGGSGRQSTASGHGAFDNDEITLASLQFIIERGMD
jgi:hypothetical protein